MKPVLLSELLDALDFDSEERVTKVDLQDGSVVSVDRSVLIAAEDDDDELLGDLPDWQKEEADIARAMVNDTGERFVDAPDKFDFHEYRQMERYIGTVEDDANANELLRAIKGKGAFRYFKDTASRLGLLDRWYRYREEAMKKFVIAWAEANKIPCQDDTGGGKMANDKVPD